MGTAMRCVVAAACLVACAVRAFAAGPSIADFAADADFSFPTLSPDGTKVAFVTRAQNSRLLMSIDLVQRVRTGIMGATVDSFDLTYCRFKGNERLLCGFRGTQWVGGEPYPVSRLVSVDVSGTKKPRVLVQNGTQGGSQFQDRILDWQVDDPKHVLIALSGDGDPFPNVHSLDIETGITSVVQRSRHPILAWTTDRNGIVRFGFGYDEKKQTYITRDGADAPWRTLAKWNWGDSDFDVIGFGPTPGTLLVGANHNGRNAIFELDLGEKSDRQLLFANSEVDVGEALYWPADQRIIGFSYETDRVHRKFFDAKAENIYASIDKALPDADNDVVSASSDGTKLLVASHTDVHPSSYYVLDTTAGKLLRVGSANPALANVPLAPMKTVKIKGPDGAMLPGYLTLPLGSGGKKVPLIVYPHGGPHARDSWGYDFMVQFMASRGYAVLQVNFRGSTGYGWDWYEAGLRNWGTVMVDDITAATKWAIAEGIADPADTCIVGWSYGGYAALMSGCANRSCIAAWSASRASPTCARSRARMRVFTAGGSAPITRSGMTRRSSRRVRRCARWRRSRRRCCWCTGMRTSRWTWTTASGWRARSRERTSRLSWW